ncbi:MAG: hypothetical protein ACO1TE_04145 [Prosthecobacter sp.]
MKFWIVLFLLAGVLVARGQFYAPATHFHDPVQRLFPVEAARVAAWLDGFGDATSVEWEVRSGLGRDTTWFLVWKDAKDAVMHEATVKYTEASLKSGAPWFREVWQQVAAPWNIPQPGEAPVAALRDAFWQGMHAADTAVTRLGKVEKARAFALEHPPRGNSRDAMELAGRMTQAGVLALVTPVTLDSLVLARAAAWLAYAEGGTEQPVAELWAPLLCLSGRAPLARAAWQSALPVEGKVSLLQQTWALVLRKNTVRDWFAQVATPGHALVALPFLAEASTAQGSGLWPQVWRDCLKPDLRLQLHDFIPRLSVIDLKVMAQHITPHMAMQARREATEALNRLGPLPEADAALVDMASNEKGDKQRLLGLADLAPLLKQGFTPKIKALRPVATITQQDLLLHLWDSEMMQLNAQRRAIRTLQTNYRAEVEKLAAAVEKLVPDFAAYARSEADPPATLRGERTEFLGSHDLTAHSLPSFYKTLREGGDVQAEEDRVHRFWLARSGVTLRALISFLQVPEPRMRFEEYAGRLLEEGGSVHASQLFSALASYGAIIQGGRLLADEDWLRRIDEACPDMIETKRNIAVRPWAPGWHSLKVAQALEPLFWQAPDSLDTTYIFWRYIEAGAFDAAKRFYSQVRGLRVDESDFKTLMAPSRWTLAFLENDRASMDAAVADSREHGILVFYHALVTGDDATALKTIEKGIADRKEAGKPEKEAHWTRLKAFMAHAPALAKPGTPEYETAMASIKKDTMWIELQWFLQQRYQLPPPEALRLVGHPRPATEEQSAFIYYLKGNRPKFEEKFRLCVGSNARSGFWRVLLPWMRMQMRGETPLPAGKQPDLRPAGEIEPLSALIRRLRGIK